MPDVSALVQQMHETLSQVHEVIASLDTDTRVHDEKLDALEARREDLVAQLEVGFQKQRDEWDGRRRSARDELAEARRREDEEIAARRRREDEERRRKEEGEDAERERALEGEKRGVEEEVEGQMDEVEEEAKRMLEEGHKKIRELEEKRRVRITCPRNASSWWSISRVHTSEEKSGLYISWLSLHEMVRWTLYTDK